MGIFKFIFFKLLPVAPRISINLPFFAILLFLGMGIKLLLDKYLPEFSEEVKLNLPGLNKTQEGGIKLPKLTKDMHEEINPYLNVDSIYNINYLKLESDFNKILSSLSFVFNLLKN